MVKLNCGVFWDIENVAVPHGCDAAGIVSTIRSTIIKPNDLEERDFYVACRVERMSNTVGNSLESMNVNIVHPFYDESKNAADTKIVLLISKFIKNWGERGCAIIVVTGDSDFLDPLLKLKLNYDLIVYLIHGRRSFSRELLWCVDVTYQLDGGNLRETSPRINYQNCSGFIKLSGLYEDSDSYKRIHQINSFCNRIKADYRVLRISKGTAWIGYPDCRKSMTEFDLRSFIGLKFLGCSPRLELVHFLWPDDRYKPKLNNQLTTMDHYSASTSDQIRSSSPAHRNNQMNIGVKVSTGYGSRRQTNKTQPKTNDVNISVSLRVTGPTNVVNSTPKFSSFNRRDKQFTNQKTDKNETHIKLPKVFSS